MGTLRTKESRDAYMKVIEAGLMANGCPLCKAESILEFNLWRIIVNAYPYDKIATVHHMLIPKRHAADQELTPEERQEFESINHAYLHDNYEYLIEASHKRKSIPEHMHLHLIVAKD